MKVLSELFAFSEKTPSQRHDFVMELSSRVMGGRVLLKPLEVTLHRWPSIWFQVRQRGSLLPHKRGTTSWGCPKAGVLATSSGKESILTTNTLGYSLWSQRVRHSCVRTDMHANISREGTRERGAQWASLVAQLVKNPPAMQESAYNTGGVGSIPGLGRSPGGGNSNPLQYSCLGNPMDRGFWWATVYGVTRVGHDLVTKPPPEMEWGQ